MRSAKIARLLVRLGSLLRAMSMVCGAAKAVSTAR